MTALPDTEALVIWFLSDALIAGGRVYGSFPEAPTYPLAVVQRVGGNPEPRWLDKADLQVDVWAATRAEARDSAANAFASLMTMEGAIDTGTVQGVVTGVLPGSGLRWLPDEDTEQPRYTFSVLVTAHP